MIRKMLSLQGLAAVLLLTSVGALSANPMLEEKDLTETSDYGVMVGGYFEGSQQNSFKAPSSALVSNFESIYRQSAVASIGFSAFGRVCLHLNVGTNQACGLLSQTVGSTHNELTFKANPSLVWGGQLGVTFYSENCVKASGYICYQQSSMQIHSMKGLVARRKLLLVPSLDTAGAKKGLFLIPESDLSSFTLPTASSTPDDAILAYMPQVTYDPNATFEYSQYELAIRFAYGQQHMMYVGAKVLGGTSTLSSDAVNLANYIGQVVEGTILDAFLMGAPGTKKIEGTRSSYIAPLIGITIADKCTQLDICATLLAQQDITVKAAISF